MKRSGSAGEIANPPPPLLHSHSSSLVQNNRANASVPCSISSAVVTPHARPLETSGFDSCPTDRLVLVLCGLPATGKTAASRKILSYLQFFLDIPGQIFNVGDYRRKIAGPNMTADFYDPKNKEALAKRNMAAMQALGDLKKFMNEKPEQGVRVGIFDATNSTMERRKVIRKELKVRCTTHFLGGRTSKFYFRQDQTVAMHKTNLTRQLPHYCFHPMCVMP